MIIEIFKHGNVTSKPTEAHTAVEEMVWFRSLPFVEKVRLVDTRSGLVHIAMKGLAY